MTVDSTVAPTVNFFARESKEVSFIFFNSIQFNVRLDSLFKLKGSEVKKLPPAYYTSFFSNLAKERKPNPSIFLLKFISHQSINDLSLMNILLRHQFATFSLWRKLPDLFRYSLGNQIHRLSHLIP